MCGIFGVVLRDSRRQLHAARVVAARDTLRHRGPDEQGLWIPPAGGVALAHQRLKVLDLTHGQQPMVSPDQRYGLVYNGEIYNFRKLQEHYRAAGLTLTTQCDTEVVLQSLIHDGPGAIEQWNGMFALGFWDTAARSLLLVRDRLGKKPLYWFADDELFVFASELKAILEYLGRKFPVDAVALDQYFARGYILSPRTIFQGIAKLPAGHTLTLDAGAWTWASKPYWDFVPTPVPTDPGEVLDHLDDLLTDAVRMRMVSDVPIGCLLSGGIDSSLITALTAKVSGEKGERVKAFSIGFDESPDHNELPYAQMVAQRHNCEWFTRAVRGGDFMAMVDDAAQFHDEPFGNFTMFSMRKLAQMAREQLVVVLTGQGGDELAAGYPGRYNWIIDQPAAARSGSRRYAAAFDDLFTYLRASSFVAWPRGREVIFSDEMRDAIRAGGPPAADLLPFWNRHLTRVGRLNNVLYTDVKTNLADYLICLEERMTMSCSLEARNPLLDYRVVNFLLSLPESMKIHDIPGSPEGRRNKWVLLELARRYVPAEAIDRPKKGFTPPLGLWISQNADRMAQLFNQTDGQTRSIYSSAWREYLRGGQYESNTLMPVFYSLMLAAWVKRYGQYVSQWPGGTPSAMGSISLDVSAAAQGDHWQAALRTQDPIALQEARWFCQAMGNFAANTRLRINGDDDGWFTFLARGSQMRIAASHEEADALVLLGAGAAESFDARDLKADDWVLWFVPFEASQANDVKTLLSQAGDAGITLKGVQAVPTGPAHGVLIARGQVGAVSLTPAP
ncbi:MAG: asparagine synthase (glutamine-hydrolyzing) [Phycisphaeraceae bacterium]|nr:asparagine synthase (glutamine-hydrolyzing) [Phycisphaeraceae bacterium]